MDNNYNSYFQKGGADHSQVGQANQIRAINQKDQFLSFQERKIVNQIVHHGDLDPH